MARELLKRDYTYNVDNASFISGVMPFLWKAVESRFYPLAEERGLTVSRDQKPVKTGHGHPVGGIANYTWRARKGLSAGFTLELEHDPRNYMHVKFTAKPFYPVAPVVSIALGVLLSYFWIPYLLDNWSPLISNWLMIGLIVVMWVLFVILTRGMIFVSGFLALASTLALGFFLGYGLGWLLGIAISQAQHGDRIQPALASLIDGLDNPPSSAPSEGLYSPARTPAYPPQGAIKYASAAPVAPAEPAAAAPRIPTPKLVGSGTRPASSISMAACPQCRGPVAVGAGSCPSCGLRLQWS